MSRLGVALRALDANRSDDGYEMLLDSPVPVPGADLVDLDRLTREHPEHTAELSEIFEVATAAERSEHLDEDQLDMLCRPRDVLTPAHGFSERTERGVVLALVITVALLFVLATFIDTPTVETFPRYTTDREVPVR